MDNPLPTAPPPPVKKKFPLLTAVAALIALVLVGGVISLSRQLVQQRQTAEPRAEASPLPSPGTPGGSCSLGQNNCTSPYICHCVGGSACQTGRCEPNNQNGLGTSCGTAWCKNTNGVAWTCCEEGYKCGPGSKGCIPEGGGGGGGGFPYQRCPTGTALIKYPGSGQVSDLCLVPGECDRYFPSRHYITDDDPDDCNNKHTRGPCEVGFLCCPPGSTITCTGTTITRSGTKCNAGEVMMSADWGAQTVVCKRGCGCGGPSPSPSPAASPSPKPLPTPSPEPNLVCLDLTKNTAAPKLGDTVTFTCKSNFSSVSSVRAYFRYSTDGGGAYSVAQPANGASVNPATKKASHSLTVGQPGNWKVQCRVCGQINDGAGTICTAWGKANVNHGSGPGLD